MQHILATTLLLGTLIASAAARLQSVAITGTLTCYGSPATPSRIELWDLDDIDPDDFMGVTMSLPDGTFFIQGKESEFLKIDPELRIYHRCGVSIARCFKQTKIEIPKEYVSIARRPEKMYRINRIELSLSTENIICSEI